MRRVPRRRVDQYPRQESNLHPALRRRVLYPLSYEGAGGEGRQIMQTAGHGVAPARAGGVPLERASPESLVEKVVYVSTNSASLIMG